MPCGWRVIRPGFGAEARRRPKPAPRLGMHIHNWRSIGTIRGMCRNLVDLGLVWLGGLRGVGFVL